MAARTGAAVAKACEKLKAAMTRTARRQHQLRRTGLALIFLHVELERDQAKTD